MACGCDLIPHPLGGGGGGGGGTGNGDVTQLIHEYEDSSTASDNVVEVLYSLDLSDLMTVDGQVLRGRIVLDSTGTGQGIDWAINFDGNVLGFLDQMIAGDDEFIIDYEITRTSVMTIRWSVTVFRQIGETYSLRLFTGDDFGLLFTDETLFRVTADVSQAGDVGILRSITGQLGPV